MGRGKLLCGYARACRSRRKLGAREIPQLNLNLRNITQVAVQEWHLDVRHPLSGPLRGRLSGRTVVAKGVFSATADVLNSQYGVQTETKRMPRELAQTLTVKQIGFCPNC